MPGGGHAVRHAVSTTARTEQANQTVTGLLQKIDGNIARATDFAAQLLPQVAQFAKHTRSVQRSVQIWADFFRSFEEEERKRFANDAAQKAPEAVDASHASLPSFFSSPRTPCLDESVRAGVKRRYGSPEMSGTPSFGQSPPKSIRLDRAPCADAEISAVSERFSPVSQPNFVAPQLDTSGVSLSSALSADFAGAASLPRFSSSVAPPAPDQSLDTTPQISSPTHTGQPIEVASARKSAQKRALQPAPATATAPAPAPARTTPARATRAAAAAAAPAARPAGATLRADQLKILPPVFRAGTGAAQAPAPPRPAPPPPAGPGGARAR